MNQEDTNESLWNLLYNNRPVMEDIINDRLLESVARKNDLEFLRTGVEAQVSDYDNELQKYMDSH